MASALRGGVSVLQLRDKTASDAAMVAQARRLKPLCTAAGVPLIVNDRLAVALAAGADGLHVGQGDGDVAAMRAALCLILPSTEEQFGLVVTEALALGLPVLVSANAGAVDELVELSGLDQERAKQLITNARSHWFE